MRLYCIRIFMIYGDNLQMYDNQNMYIYDYKRICCAFKNAAVDPAISPNLCNFLESADKCSSSRGGDNGRYVHQM